MDPALVVLVAKLLLMGPEGTRPLAEHRARIPAGSTGLLLKTLQEPGLPGALRLLVTPAGGAGSEAGGGERPFALTLRVEIWAEEAIWKAGRPPDEVNVEAVTVPSGGSALVQIAEDARGERRLMLSLAAPADDAEPPAALAPPRRPARPPREVALRVESFKVDGGGRLLLERQILRTVEGSPVSWETIRRGPGTPGPRGGGSGEERLRLTVRPAALTDGWITLEARLEAFLHGPGGGGAAEPAASSVRRTVALGIPAEIEVEIPSPSAGDGGGPRMERFVVEVTPYLPAAAPAAGS
jgi:hypothetical protein